MQEVKGPLNNGGKTAAAGENSEKPKKSLRPAQCRTHMRKALAGNFEAITDGLVKKAKAGSLPHIKLATELLEVKPEKKEKARRRGPGILTRVLKEIEHREAEKQRELAEGR